MKRRDLLLSLIGVASLSALPTALAAPEPKYPPGQTSSFFALDDAPYQLGADDFTVEFWMSPIKKQWEIITLTQERLELRGYLNGQQAASGLATLQDWRFVGAAILAQIGNGANPDQCVADFMRHMHQHMPNGHLADLRVTRSVARRATEPVYRSLYPIVLEASETKTYSVS